MITVSHLPPCQVIELRRYDIRPGQQRHFAQHFENWFPGAFQQLGALALGEGFERDVADRFTWLRGFPNMDTRAMANAAFYYGPLWKEHRQTMNDLLLDSDNVLLLRPLDPIKGMQALPSVNLVTEPAGATGVLVLHIFPVRGEVDIELAQVADAAFANYQMDGVRVAGTLVTLNVPNNFPQLPIRDDGPWLVWAGVLRDQHLLETAFRSTADVVEHALQDRQRLRGNAELVVMEPAPLSRLRWLETEVTSNEKPA